MIGEEQLTGVSQEFGSVIVNWMRQRSIEGRFEHSVPEIADGLRRGREEVVGELARLEAGPSPRIQHRTRGPKRRQVPYYYLKVVRDICKKEFSRSGKS